MGRESWYEAANVTVSALASLVDQIAMVFAVEKEQESVNKLRVLMQIIKLLSF